MRPLRKVESHFADSKFFKEGFVPKEMMISTISSRGKDNSKAIKDTLVAMGHNGANTLAMLQGGLV